MLFAPIHNLLIMNRTVYDHVKPTGQSFYACASQIVNALNASIAISNHEQRTDHSIPSISLFLYIAGLFSVSFMFSVLSFLTYDLYLAG